MIRVSRVIRRTREHRWSDDHSGQAMIEMALLMPLVFLLILMVIEMGFLLWTNLNVKQAARETARLASVGQVGKLVGGASCATQATTIKGRAYAAAVGRIDCDDVTVAYVDREGTPSIGRGDSVIIEIDHPYDSLTGFLRMIGVATPLTIRACADARVESPPDAADATAHLDNTAGCV